MMSYVLQTKRMVCLSESPLSRLQIEVGCDKTGDTGNCPNIMGWSPEEFPCPVMILSSYSLEMASGRVFGKFRQLSARSYTTSR